MARGKRKNGPSLKILAVLKSGYQTFLENAWSESNFSKEENETHFVQMKIKCVLHKRLSEILLPVHLKDLLKRFLIYLPAAISPSAFLMLSGMANAGPATSALSCGKADLA